MSVDDWEQVQICMFWPVRAYSSLSGLFMHEATG